MATYNDIPSILEDFCGWCTEKRVHFGPPDDVAHMGRELTEDDMVLVNRFINERGGIVLNSGITGHDLSDTRVRPRAHPSPLSDGVVPYQQPVFTELPKTDGEAPEIPTRPYGGKA